MIASSAFLSEIASDQLKDLFLLLIKTHIKYQLQSALLLPAAECAITLCMILDCSEYEKNQPWYSLLMILMLCKMFAVYYF